MLLFLKHTPSVVEIQLNLLGHYVGLRTVWGGRFSAIHFINGLEISGIEIQF